MSPGPFFGHVHGIDLDRVIRGEIVSVQRDGRWELALRLHSLPGAREYLMRRVMYPRSLTRRQRKALRAGYPARVDRLLALVASAVEQSP